MPWGEPELPTTSPAATGVPTGIDTSQRNEVDTLVVPDRIVTVCIPATDPAKLTVPPIGALTAVPTGAAKSTPQWPAYWP